MAEPTEADRERAAHIVANWTVNFSPDQPDALENMISTYLADERERARAPFLAVLADHLPVPGEDHFASVRYSRDMCSCGEQFHDDCEIRLAFSRAAEETGQ
jgi:hypothetical protein